MRREARELAFKVIFENEFNNVDVELSFMSELDEREVPAEDRDFALTLFNLSNENKEEIENLISSKIVGYEYNRLYKVDISLLKLAVAEIRFYKETPTAVVVNEVLELAKKYSTEKSPSFVNGVLSSIYKQSK